DGRVDDLEPALRAAGQELVDRAEALVHDLPPVVDAHDRAGILIGREELRDRGIEGASDALDRCDRWRRDAALHLGQEALGHRGARGELTERLVAATPE